MPGLTARALLSRRAASGVKVRTVAAPTGPGVLDRLPRVSVNVEPVDEFATVRLLFEKEMAAPV